MSTLLAVDDILGAHETSCGGCRRALTILEDRTRCITCDRNYCRECARCEHAAMLLKGFPELLDDLPTLTRKAAEIFKDLQGLFQARDNIYFYSICRTGELLQRRAAGASFEDVYKDVPEDLACWHEHTGEAALRRLVSLKAMGRFVDYFDRRSFKGRSSNTLTFRTSQGVVAPLYWQGLPMMKSVWDFALVPIMVQEIRPRTVIEIGTAEGGSAAYYASVQQLHGLPPNVVTMDLIPPRSSIAGVRFVQGDSELIESALPGELLEDLPHPWIVAEDSHRNIGGIIAHFHRFLRAGDYLAIEDVDAERDLFPFLSAHRDHYRVDTRYTDFFGHNNTCCPDQIFCRTHLSVA
jgi:cephalosporin hydroxylase